MKNHYYNQLNSTEKQVYDIIKNGLFRFDTQIAIPLRLANAVDVPRIYIYISCDYPKVFYVNFYDYHYVYTATDFVIEPYYWYTASQIAKMDGKIDKLLQKIASKVNDGTQYQKVKSLYELLATNVTYQRVDQADRHKKVHETNTIMGVLFYKKGMCEGVAKVFQLVANMVGVQCITVHGYGNQQYHAWNIVQIDGATYHVDATYAMSEYAKTNQICYDYLNLSDKDVSQTHKPSYPVPRCNATKYNYYTQSNLVAKSPDDIQRIVQACTQKQVVFRYDGIYANDVHAAAQECCNWIHYYNKRAKNVAYVYSPSYRICRVNFK